MGLGTGATQGLKVIPIRKVLYCDRHAVLIYSSQAPSSDGEELNNLNWVTRYIPLRDASTQKGAEQTFSTTNGKHLIRKTPDGRYYEVAVYHSLVRHFDRDKMLGCYQDDSTATTDSAVRYDEFKRRAVKGIRAYGNTLGRYYRRHSFYPFTAAVIEVASFLKDIEDSNRIQKALQRDLILLSCLLDTDTSRYLHVNTNVVATWQSYLDELLRRPSMIYEDEQKVLLQTALLRCVLGASGGKTAEVTETVFQKNTPGQNLKVLSSVIGGKGEYNGTENDPKTISAALVGHHLFEDQNPSPTAIEMRLGELRCHVPIAYPDVVSKPFQRATRLATDYQKGLPRLALVDMTIENIQAFRAYTMQTYIEFPSLNTGGNDRWLLFICPALDARIDSLVKFARTRIGFQTFFQQAADQVLKGQDLDQLVLCLLVMLRYQELVSSGLKQSKSPPYRPVVEDFCTLMGEPDLVPDIRTTVGLMVRSLQRVSITSARDKLASFIIATVNLEAYPDTPDGVADTFWSWYIEKKDINEAIRQAIGNKQESSSYKGRLIPEFMRGGMDSVFKSNVDNSIRQKTLQRYLPGDSTAYRSVPFSSMLAFARLVDCRPLLEEVKAHVPAGNVFRFVPTARRILHCLSIPEWSFDLKDWSAALCRWEVTELRSSELFSLAEAYGIDEILSWKANQATWYGNPSAFRLGRLDNRTVIFHNDKCDWFYVCSAQHVEYLDREQDIEAIPRKLSSIKRKPWPSEANSTLRRKVLVQCGMRASHSTM